MEVRASNNKLSIPLYHGTSTFFLQSILENGLGGINPVEQFGLLDFFGCAYDICEQLFRSDSGWEAEKYVAEKIKNQSNEDYNFRHGGTYLSPSRDTAVRYAIHNPYGSEMLSESLYLYEKIKAYDKRFDTQHSLHPVLNKPIILQVLEQKIAPILIEVLDIPIRNLRSEDSKEIGGKGVKEIEDLMTAVNNNHEKVESSFELECLKTKYGDNSKEVIAYKKSLRLKNVESVIQHLAQQTNFELIQPVQVEQLKVYNIIVSDYQKLDYELCKIRRC